MTDKIEVTQRAREAARDFVMAIFDQDNNADETAERAIQAFAHFEHKTRLAGERAGILRAAEWQPIETAPKDGTWLMCWGPDCLHGIAKFYPNPIWAEYPEYTYWQTLPAPPAIRAEAGEAS